jgi:hypothetical protein
MAWSSKAQEATMLARLFVTIALLSGVMTVIGQLIF